MTGSRRRFFKASGFTLIEILVALAVVSTAATILISLFGSSLTLSRLNRSKTVAASLAQEQLDFILRNPEHYIWKLEGSEPGQLVEIEQVGAAKEAGDNGAAGNSFHPLVVVPVEPRASTREENFYGKYRWQAYAALPQPQANHVDITVVVRWKDAGKDRSIALTSSAPRFALGTKLMAQAGGNI